MAVLRLVYFDTNNEERTVLVDKDIFTVGRSSENDLSVPDSRLSRDHLEIERAYGEFTARDVGSSNGTKHNGYDLTDAVVIRNGDEFDLGGGLLIKTVLDDGAKEREPEPSVEETAPAASKKAAPAAAASSGSSSSLLTMLILIIPAAGIVLLLLVGGAFLLVRNSGTDSNDRVYSDRTDTDSDDEATVSTPTPKKDIPDDDPGPSDDPSDDASGGDDLGTDASPTPAEETPEFLAEKHGAEFLRAIAQNEPRAFLTGEQGRIVAQKIKSIASPTLAENIKSAKSNASQIRTIAAAQNLKPQILAAAAIAKMGGGRGDVVQTAKTMAETLSVLRTQIGQEFGDDVLLTIAAYEQGAAGDTMKMRNMLQALAGKKEYQVSTRTIRSIWFLKKNDLITDQQYEFALRFLAVGTVMQNPKAFNVNAEPVVF